MQPQDSTDRFITDHVQLAGAGRYPRSDLYQKYLQWCTEHELPATEKREFNQAVQALPGVRVIQVRWSADEQTRSTPAWSGLTYQEALKPEEKSAHIMQRQLEDVITTLNALSQIVTTMQQQLQTVQDQLTQRSAPTFRCAKCGQSFTNVISKMHHGQRCSGRKEV